MGSTGEPRVPVNPGDRAVDEWRPVKAICIGAGMSGITAGCMLPRKIPNLDFVIYEKNEDVGGGWFENHYPGLQPDLTPHTYQYTFASNPRWSRFYPPGAEFLNYLRAVSKKFGVYERTKFGHKFLGAKWIEADGQWEVDVLRLSDNTVIKDRAEIMIKCTGLVNDWRWPDIPGREEFQGKIMHTANWDDMYDLTDKRVAVIGYGATGVQITPAIQPKVKHLDHYVRGQVHVPPFGGTAADELMRRGAKRNFDHPPDEIKQFTKEPLKYLEYRKRIEHLCNGVQQAQVKDSKANDDLTKLIEESMKTTLAPKPGYYEALKPDFPVGCRRLVMGQGWLECLVQPNADLITTEIARITKEGIEDKNGKVRGYDVIICATGFDTKLDDRKTPYVGQDGITLAEVWDPEPVAYFSVAAEKMPNLFILFGPNSAPVSGSISHTMEGACGYIIQCIKKLQQEYLKSMVPKRTAIENWMNQVDFWASRMTLSGTCRTWFKRNIPDGRVIINWPGSAMNAYHGWRNPRWEDFDYQSWLPEDQTLRWLGNGMSYAEKYGLDTTDYMSFTDVTTVLTEEDLEAIEKS